MDLGKGYAILGLRIWSWFEELQIRNSVSRGEAGDETKRGCSKGKRSRSGRRDDVLRHSPLAGPVLNAIRAFLRQ